MFMRENVHVCRRLVMSLALSLVLLLTFAPAVLASSQNMRSGHNLKSTLVGPKQHYLALGDSLAFGYQPDLNFTSGYVDDYYSHMDVQYLSRYSCYHQRVQCYCSHI